MNQTNHTPRGRGRGRGGRSRGRIYPNSRLHSVSDTLPLPTTTVVVPGSPVSIVLKADQPTGRQVQGIVAELLTKGDHPRGIKVRLQDGRVGRVQRMVSEDAAKAGSEGLSGLGRNGEVSAGAGVQNAILSAHQSVRVSGAGSGEVGTAVKYGDYREDGYVEPEREEASLLDYVVVKGGKKKGKGKKAVEESMDAQGSAGDNERAQVGEQPKLGTTVCPVCGEFEGDENAVAHHVSGHFE